MTNMTNTTGLTRAKGAPAIETTTTAKADQTALANVQTGQRTEAEDTAAVKSQIAAARAEGHKVVTDKGGRRFIVERLASGMTIRTPVG
jgi:hypothetical protein